MVYWLLGKHLLRYDAKNLPDEIVKSGASYRLIEFDSIKNEILGGPITIPEGMPVVYYGTIEFVRFMMSKFKGLDTHVPGPFGYKNNVDCMWYLTHYPRSWFLNGDGHFTTWGDLKNRMDYWYDLFGKNNTIFVRPNSGFKTFTGFTVSYDQFWFEVKGHDQTTGVTDDTIILVSAPKDIRGEFRFLVVDGEVVTGTEYRWDGVLDIRRDWPQECFELAQEVAAYGRKHCVEIDKAYVIDVALTDHEPKVVEFNSFSSAGLYAMDMEKVVAAINKAATNEYKDYWGT